MLGLDDRLAIQRLVAMKPDARAVLNELPAAELKTLARLFDETQLTSLSSYLTGLSKDGGLRILTSVSRNPQKMQMLARGHVRNAVLGSADQAAAVDVALRADGWLDLAAIEPDVRLVLDGRISPVLLWDKHPVAVVAAGFFGLILLELDVAHSDVATRRAVEPPAGRACGGGWREVTRGLSVDHRAGRGSA